MTSFEHENTQPGAGSELAPATIETLRATVDEISERYYDVYPDADRTDQNSLRQLYIPYGTDTAHTSVTIEKIPARHRLLGRLLLPKVPRRPELEIEFASIYPASHVMVEEKYSLDPYDNFFVNIAHVRVTPTGIKTTDRELKVRNCPVEPRDISDIVSRLGSAVYPIVS